MEKMRLFLISQKTGAPVAGAPVLFWEETTGESDDGESMVLGRRSLGVAASDRSGYVSAPLPNLSGSAALVIQPFADPDLEVRIPTAGEIAPGTTSVFEIPYAITIPDYDPRIKGLTPRAFLPPSIVDPDENDREFSPGSFSSEGGMFIGADGCEELLHTAVNEHVFRFSYVLRSPEDSPVTLDRVEGAACEKEAPADLPQCWWPGLLLEYEMSWTPRGHGLGEIVYGTTLGPCESVNLAVIDWTRRDQLRREDTTALGESYAANLERDRLVEETVRGMLQEWQRGGSILGGIAAAFPLGDIGAGVASLGGGYLTSSGDRSISADAAQRLADGIRQAATSSRRLHSTVVMEASQGERDVVETRTIANHNHCHSLNFLFYEILRHYRIDVKLVNTQDAVLVKRPLLDFTDSEILHRYKHLLRPALIEPKLGFGFGALDRLRAAEYRFDRGRYPLDPPDYPLGELQVLFRTTSAEPPPDGSSVRLWVGTHAGSELVPLILVRPKLAAHQEYHRPDFDSDDSPPLGQHLSKAKLVGPTLAEFRAESPDREPGWFWPDMPRDRCLFSTQSEDIVWMQTAEPLRWGNVDNLQIQLVDTHHPRAAGSGSLEISALVVSTEHHGHRWVLHSGPPGPDDHPMLTLSEGDARHTIPVDRWAPREPSDLVSDEDHVAIHALQGHLMDNRVYYSRVVWLNEDADERARWLDAVSRREDGTRLLDEVENRVGGILGDYIALPEGSTQLAQLVDDPNLLRTTYVALPTRGLFGEAKLSHCNACEKRDPTRFWDWSESPCPSQAPEIQGITPGSRARDIAVEPSELPTPTVGPQEVPEAPDPGQMVAGVLDLLKTPDIFNDMSGAEQVAGVLGKLIEGAVDLAGKRVDSATELEKARIAGESGGREPTALRDAAASDVAGGVSPRERSRSQPPRRFTSDGVTYSTPGSPEDVYERGVVARDVGVPDDVVADDARNALWTLASFEEDVGPTSGAEGPCITEPPADPEMVILNTETFPPPTFLSTGGIVPFRNWGFPDAGERPYHFVFAANDPDRPRVCHDPADINLFALHETTNPNTDPTNPATMIQKKTGVHFMIARDGALTQHNDVVERMVHVSGYNDNSIGVEVANRVWTTSSDPLGIEIEWGLGQRYYQVPPLDQLETVVSLVNWVLEHPRLNVPAVWPQVTFLPRSGGFGFFMAATGAAAPRYSRDTIRGVASHFVLDPDHSDGSFLALYTWVRLQGPGGSGIADPVAARDEAVRLAQRPVERALGEVILDLGAV